MNLVSSLASLSAFLPTWKRVSHVSLCPQRCNKAWPQLLGNTNHVKFANVGNDLGSCRRAIVQSQLNDPGPTICGNNAQQWRHQFADPNY